jgi:hypothetical protein
MQVTAWKCTFKWYCIVALLVKLTARGQLCHCHMYSNWKHLKVSQQKENDTHCFEKLMLKLE